MTSSFLDYNSLTKQLKALIEDENEAITILSNTSSLLYWNLFDVNWLGFYFIKNNELILGPWKTILYTFETKYWCVWGCYTKAKNHKSG